MPKYDCISIGSAMVDIIVKSEEFKLVKSSKFQSSTAICELLGSKIEVDSMVISSGGGATNSSCALSYFGLKTACLSAVSTDSLSEIIIDDLKKFKVNLDFLEFIKKESTPVSIILTAKNGGRTVLTKRGIASLVNLDFIKKQKLDTRWIYLTNLGEDFEKAKEVIKFLKSLNLRIFWNPGLNELKDLNIDFLSTIDILLLNIEESLEVSKKNGLNLMDTINYFAKNIKSKVTIITAAEKGAFLIANNHCYYVEGFEVENIQCTVGAGDAFGSGFLYGVIKNLSFDLCLEYAIKNSTSIIKSMGAKEMFVKDLRDFLKPKIKKLF